MNFIVQTLRSGEASTRPADRAGRPTALEGPGTSNAARSDHRDLAPLSIYHEPWWLDIAAGQGRWDEARVVDNGVLIARLPYCNERRLGFSLSRMPPMIRTLGPHIAALPGKQGTAFRRRMEITDQLIDQLPPLDVFDQVFDPRVEDVLAFVHRGFVAGAAYSFRTEPGQTHEAIWSGMMDTRRRVIRRAEAELGVAPIEDVEEFCRFYERNLGDEGNLHDMGVMHRLLEAALARGAGTLLGARTKGGELAAAVGIVWDDTAAYYLLGTRAPELDHANGGVSLLMWKAIQLACGRGLMFDFDGATTPGLVRFLSGFGAKLVTRLRVRRNSKRVRAASLALGLIGRGI